MRFARLLGRDNHTCSEQEFYLQVMLVFRFYIIIIIIDKESTIVVNMADLIHVKIY